ncbi:hypothetical protein Sros01_74070 [Streptomyces roseochromogenus]|nr:hypothetical protein Sros01_74070 [Streptomyces roseochromogenus]
MQGGAQHRGPVEVHLAGDVHDKALLIAVHPYAAVAVLLISHDAHHGAGWAVGVGAGGGPGVSLRPPVDPMLAQAAGTV